jgi:hypothetical protein
MCVFRKSSTLDSGKTAAPSACINGEYNLGVQGKEGSCSGIFYGRPTCKRFFPTDETKAGRLLLAVMKKPEPEPELKGTTLHSVRKKVAATLLEVFDISGSGLQLESIRR